MRTPDPGHQRPRPNATTVEMGSIIANSILVSQSDPPDDSDIKGKVEVEVRTATPESHHRSRRILNCYFPDEIPETTDPGTLQNDSVALEDCVGIIQQESPTSSKGKGRDLSRSYNEDSLVSFYDDDILIATDSTNPTAYASPQSTSDTAESPNSSHDSSPRLPGSLEPVNSSRYVQVLIHGDALDGQASHIEEASINQRASLGTPPDSIEGYVAGNPLHSFITPTGDDVLPSHTRPMPLAAGSSVFRSIFRSRAIRSALAIKFDFVLRLAYHWMFLQIPMFYFTRVTRIFKEVRLSTDDLTKKVIQTLVNQETQGQRLGTRAYFIDIDDPQVSNLKTLWESFIDSLMREWKTLNIVSVLLMSAIIGTLQINAAFSDPLVRMSVFTSLICALMSLIYGGMFIIRFSNMRRVHKAIEWAKEGESTSTAIFWNVWVLLAMPAIWLSWSLILYVIGIMSFIWRAGFNGEAAANISPRAELGIRISISCILLLGLVYLALIIGTLKHYGEQMDVAWKEKVRNKAPKYNTTFEDTPRSRVQDIPLPFDEDIQVEPQHKQSFIATQSKHSERLSRTLPSGLVFHQAVEVIRFTIGGPQASEMPHHLANRGLNIGTWNGFIEHAWLAWNDSTKIRSETDRRKDVLRVITTWNGTLFCRLNFEVILCCVYPTHSPRSPFFAVFLTDFNTYAPSAMARFGHIPRGFGRVDIYEADRPVVSLLAADHYPPSPTDDPEIQTYHGSDPPSKAEPLSRQSSLVDLNIKSPTLSDPFNSPKQSSRMLPPNDVDEVFNTEICSVDSGQSPPPRAKNALPQDNFHSSENAPVNRSPPMDDYGPSCPSTSIVFEDTIATPTSPIHNTDRQSISVSPGLSDSPDAIVKLDRMGGINADQLGDGVLGAKLTRNNLNLEAHYGNSYLRHSSSLHPRYVRQRLGSYPGSDTGTTSLKARTPLYTRSYEDLYSFGGSDMHPNVQNKQLQYKECSAENPAERPGDWRPDYVSGLTSRVPETTKHRSDVTEWNDPVTRSVHSYLACSQDPPMHRDLRHHPFPFGTSDLTFEFPRYSSPFETTRPPPKSRHLPDPLGPLDPAQLATSPPVSRMRLFHPLLPWYIDIVQTHPNGVTVQDVILQMFLQMDMPIEYVHWFNIDMDDSVRESIKKEYLDRVKGNWNMEDIVKGVKRVDFLRGCVEFEGLVKGSNGLWEIKTTHREHWIEYSPEMEWEGDGLERGPEMELEERSDGRFGTQV
ncbi:hypothetical protein Hypma_002755 [Hypsizygus marmoreus]|uniref:DUF6699 domain-containing protein n=1 Tax=Hypsizygus marmoreus TaxID=39966 RepID=A0A369J4V1_HYPMA|nr:hypothetical protein Hypma_002755 [Hypsizygus marmoreus]